MKNIEIFVVIHEKAIQRSLKYEKETKSSEKNVLILFAEEGKRGSASEQKEEKKNKQKIKTPHSTSPHGCWDVASPNPLVDGSLEDESDVTLLTSQLLGTEGAGGVEGVRAVRQRDLTPEGRCLL